MTSFRLPCWRSPHTRGEATGWIIWSLLAFVAVVLLWRRSLGAFTQLAPAGAAITAALCTGALSLAGLWSQRFGTSDAPSSRRAIAVAITLALLPVVAVSSLNHTATVAGLVLIGISMGSLAAWVSPVDIQRIVSHWLLWCEQKLTTTDVSSAVSTSTIDNATGPAAIEPSPATREDDPDVQHWMTRRSTVDDGQTWDTLEGATTVLVAAGQRRVSVHIAISPAMLDTPEIECELLDDIVGRVEAAVVQPYGFRIDVRLTSDAPQDCTLRLGYTAAVTVPQSSRCAA